MGAAVTAREWFGRQFTAAEREKSRKVATVLIAALLMVMLFCTLNWFFTTVLL